MERHRAALALAAAALLLGLAGNLLLRWEPWGLNVPLWTALFVAVSLACAAHSERRVSALSRRLRAHRGRETGLA